MKPKVHRVSLKTRLLWVSSGVMLFVFVIEIVMFLYTTSSLQKKSVESLHYVAKQISTEVDKIIYNIQNVSDAFANEPRLQEYLDQDFSPVSGRGIIEKQHVMEQIRIHIFGGFNRLHDINQISAIYNVPNHELFNFLDPNVLGEDSIESLLTLGINDAEKLSQYHWYNLQPNFLRSFSYNNPRLDNAIIGSRRVYSGLRLTYPYVHVFAIPEQRVFDCYKSVIEPLGGEAYLLNIEGELISSSNLEALAILNINSNLKQAVLQSSEENFEWRHLNKDYFVSICQSELDMNGAKKSGWLTVLVVPKQNATKDINAVYVSIFIVMIVTVGLFGFLLFYLYKQFMDPISTLNNAMKRVDKGDLQAFVQPKPSNDEVEHMLQCYNQMLASINRNVKEKMELEQVKKKLDMQVLTNQINPHFLYNTLETIVWKAGEAGRPDIAKIAASLGKLYRLSISGNEVWIPLRQELEHTKSYIEIQRSRYKDQFKFIMEVDEAALNIQIPKIILQPIIENIFLYSVQQNQVCVTIRLKIRILSDGMHIIIVDNGPGMSPTRLCQVRTLLKTGVLPVDETDLIPQRRGTGIGLHNIQARLALYMKVEDALKIYSKQGWGTKICIFIPTNNLK